MNTAIGHGIHINLPSLSKDSCCDKDDLTTQNSLKKFNDVFTTLNFLPKHPIS